MNRALVVLCMVVAGCRGAADKAPRPGSVLSNRPRTLQITYEIDLPSADKAGRAAAVATIRARLDARKLTDVRVVAERDLIVVELPGRAGDDIERIKSLITRAGVLDLQVVDHGNPYMQQLFAHVGSEGKAGDPTNPEAIAAGVRAEIDQWQVDSSGSTHIDYYLVADGREKLERYVESLIRSDSRFTLPSDRQLGYERIAEPGRPTAWRTYLLERDAPVVPVQTAKAMHDPHTDRHIVVLDFSRDGARAFEDLTSKIVGKKLAIILDGQITSAPIIMGTISGGRASITMGAKAPAEQAREAEELATVLTTGALPAPLREVSVREVP